MKMMFFKTRTIATLIMLSVFATCAVISRPAGHHMIEQEQKPIVIIYSTDWCGYCTKAKAFMRKNNIKFIEKNPKNPKDFKELLNLAKKLGINTNSLNVVPIFVIKNKIIIGFNPEEILCQLSNRKCSTDFIRVKERF